MESSGIIIGCLILFAFLLFGLFMALRENYLTKKRAKQYADACGKLFESVTTLVVPIIFREIAKRKTNKRTE